VSRIAAGIKIDMRAPLARNIANNLYEASKDADGKTRNLGTAERREVIAQTVLQWLRQRGRFFSHAELKGHAQSMFFDASTNELMLMVALLVPSYTLFDAVKPLPSVLLIVTLFAVMFAVVVGESASERM
jgi:hypothetical protein